MKKIFLVDQDETFQAVMISLCREENVDLRIYTTSMEVLPLIEKENPALIFLDLELPDINDFVMFDLLKKADTLPPIPVLITYTDRSEKELQNYKNLKFQPQGYHKKPIQDKNLRALLSIYLGDIPTTGNKEDDYISDDISDDNTGNKEKTGTKLAEDDDIIFSAVLSEPDIEENPLDALIEEPAPKKQIGAVFKVSDGEYVDLKERTDERERAARLVSLEKQNHFLMTENKRLLNELNTLNEKPHQLESEFKKKIDENKKTTEYLEKQIDELKGKLTDKERELIARDHEFENKLKNELDETIRETEERMRMEVGQIYMNEVTLQKETNIKLQHDLAGLKEIEASHKASIAGLGEEKTALTEKLSELENDKKSMMKKVMTLEVDLANLGKEKEILEKETEEKIKSLTASIEILTQERELAREESKDYRNRIDMLDDLLHKAVTLTRG